MNDDRIHPSSKPNNGAPKPPLKPTGNPRRPLPPAPRRRRRGVCCSLCLWLTLIILIVAVLAAVAAGALYLIYHPKKPQFTLNAVKLQTLNITAGNLLTSRLEVNVTVRNPNDKLDLYYDDFSLFAETEEVGIGEGIAKGFELRVGDLAGIETVLRSEGAAVEAKEASELRKKSRVGVEVGVETRVKARVGALKTKRMVVRVRCPGVQLEVTKGNKTAVAVAPNSECGVRLRLKIWRWYIG